MKSRFKNNKGFTLVEITIAMLLLVLLIAASAPFCYTAGE